MQNLNLRIHGPRQVRFPRIWESPDPMQLLLFTVNEKGLIHSTKIRDKIWMIRGSRIMRFRNCTAFVWNNCSWKRKARKALYTDLPYCVIFMSRPLFCRPLFLLSSSNQFTPFSEVLLSGWQSSRSDEIKSTSSDVVDVIDPGEGRSMWETELGPITPHLHCRILYL